MHHKGAHTYTQEQINYDERILFIDRSAGSGADIIAKGWEENHWARPTIKDSYFPSEETELILDLLKEGGQTGGQKSGRSTTKKTTEKVLDLLKSNPYLTNREMADMLTLSDKIKRRKRSSKTKIARNNRAFQG